MAKFIVNAEKQYLAKMRRSYELEVDEEEVIAWATAKLPWFANEGYKCFADVPSGEVEELLHKYIDSQHQQDFDTCEELDEVEGHYKAQTIRALWEVQMEKVDEEVAA